MTGFSGTSAGIRSRRTALPGRGAAAALALVFVMAAGGAPGQQLRFVAGYREIEPPDYANLRLGPFYSNLRFNQTAGLRYSASTTNIINVVSGARKGAFKKDGFELPLVSSLSMRNYLPISKNADLDASASCSYSHYPMKTQEDQFEFSLADQQITADFSVNYQNRLAPNLNVKGYTKPMYSTDYVDLTGRIDEYGGSAYERFQNVIGIQADYLARRNMNLTLDVSRSDVWPQVNAFSNQMSTTYEGGIGYEWEVHPKLAAGARAQFSSASYPQSKNSGFLSQSYTVFGGAGLTENTRVSASLGYSLSGQSSSSESGEADSGTVIGTFGIANELAKNMQHTFSFSRSQHRGFQSGIETTDSLKYSLSRKGEFISATFTAGADSVDVTAGDTSGYASRQVGASFTVPVVPEVTVTLSTDYSTRENGEPAADVTEPELTSNYDTWVSRISTGWQLMREMSVNVYAQYARRGSASSAMQYEQIMVGADCGYSYEF